MEITELIKEEAGILEKVLNYVKNKYGVELSPHTRLTVKRQNFRIGVKFETWIKNKYYAVATFIDNINYKILLATTINLAEEIINARLSKSN